MKKHQAVVHFQGHLNSDLLQLPGHAEEQVVGIPVVPGRLLLPTDDQSRFGRLPILSQGHVESEKVLEVLRDPVHFAD